MDILIYAKPGTVKHKMADQLPKKPKQYCYWTGRRPSGRNNDKIEKGYFSDGNRIFAEGKYIINGQAGQGVAFWFHPLKRVNRRQPRKPPMRGWCYI